MHLTQRKINIILGFSVFRFLFLASCIIYFIIIVPISVYIFINILVRLKCL